MKHDVKKLLHEERNLTWKWNFLKKRLNSYIYIYTYIYRRCKERESCYLSYVTRKPHNSVRLFFKRILSILPLYVHINRVEKINFRRKKKSLPDFNPNYLKFHPLSNEPTNQTPLHIRSPTIEPTLQRKEGAVLSRLVICHRPLYHCQFLRLVPPPRPSLHEMLQLNHASRQPGKGGRRGSSEAFVNRARRRARGDTAGHGITWQREFEEEIQSGVGKERGTDGRRRKGRAQFVWWFTTGCKLKLKF